MTPKLPILAQGSWLPPNMWFLGSPQIQIPNTVSINSTVLTELTLTTKRHTWTDQNYICYYRLHIMLCIVKRANTHTRLTALCLGLPKWVGTRKVKPIWILLKQETVSGSGISWDMQVCTSLQADNHASTAPLSFLQARCSVKAIKAKTSQKCCLSKYHDVMLTYTRVIHKEII